MRSSFRGFWGRDAAPRDVGLCNRFVSEVLVLECISFSRREGVEAVHKLFSSTSEDRVVVCRDGVGS